MEQRQYRLGLVSVSFRQHSPKEILEAMKKEGLSCIEWGSDVHAPYHAPDQLAKIVELQKQYGITCASYGTYFRLGETPMEELPLYIAAAKILGTDILRLWCGTKSGADMTPTEKEALLGVCQKAAEIAKNANVILCMECHKRTFTERPEDAIWLMKQVNSPHFRMYWQPFQWKTEVENLSYAQAICHMAEHIHVFNWRDQEKLPLADAIAAWRAYLSKFSTPRTLLLEFMPDDRIESLPIETNALKNIIGEMK